MEKQEKEEDYKWSDYMNCSKCMRPEHRMALCNWGYQIIDRYNGVSRSVAVIAISYFDRFMSTSPGSVSVSCSQLAFISCLLIALKAHAGFSVEPQFVSDVICMGSYSVDEINDMELIVLRDLKWRLNGPTPHDFIDWYLGAMSLTDAMQPDFLEECSKAIVELAVTKYSVALNDPSKIAFASICCALQHLAWHRFTVLHCLRTVSGLELCDPSTKDIFDAMIGFMSEVSIDDDSSSEQSVSSEASPTTIRDPC